MIELIIICAFIACERRVNRLCAYFCMLGLLMISVRTRANVVRLFLTTSYKFKRSVGHPACFNLFNFIMRFVFWKEEENSHDSHGLAERKTLEEIQCTEIEGSPTGAEKRLPVGGALIFSTLAIL